MNAHDNLAEYDDPANYDREATDGRFVVSTVVPTTGLQTDKPTERHWFSYTDRRGLTVRVSGTQRYDRLRQVKTETAYRRWWDADGQEVVRCAPLMLRYTFPKELEALLHYNGFTVTDRFGDWDGGALTGESGQLICVCRKTR
jgi:hypothetical protein